MPTPLYIIKISIAFLSHFCFIFLVDMEWEFYSPDRWGNALGAPRLQITIWKIDFALFSLLLRKPEIANYHLKIGGGPSAARPTSRPRPLTY